MRLRSTPGAASKSKSAKLAGVGRGREPEPVGEFAGLGGVDFLAQQVFQCRGHRPALGLGHRYPVVLGHRGERRSHPPARRVADGGHPVEPPDPGETTQLTGGRVECFDQVSLLLARCERGAPLAGVRERPDQQVRGLAPPLGLGRVREIEPVPLDLLARRMRDHRRHPTRRGRARLAVRP